MSQSGTIAIVTGSARGLGRGFAEAILNVRQQTLSYVWISLIFFKKFQLPVYR